MHIPPVLDHPLRHPREGLNDAFSDAKLDLESRHSRSIQVWPVDVRHLIARPQEYLVKLGAS